MTISYVSRYCFDWDFMNESVFCVNVIIMTSSGFSIFQIKLCNTSNSFQKSKKYPLYCIYFAII